MSEPRVGAETKRFGRTAGLLSAGVGAAGLLTYLFFSLASHNLSADEYGEIVVLWSAVFLTISVAHRPVEQFLSRTISDRSARGTEISSALRVAAAIQVTIALLLAGGALALRDQLQNGLLSGSESLYWVLVVSIVSFGASFYARGFLAGSRRFAALAGLLVAEAAARAGFALALAVGISDGQTVVALGVAAAPVIGLAATPVILAVFHGRADRPDEVGAPVSAAAGGSFAAAVFVVMLGEQIFLNAGPLLVRGFVDAAAAGFIFNVLMVARAPVLIFQGVATSLLPHLTRLRASGEDSDEEFRQSIRATLAAVAVFALLVFALVSAVGPALMQIAFGDRFEYDRPALMLMAGGLGFYLAATTLSQAALARGAARSAAACWGFSAAVFLSWCLLPIVEDEARRVEIGFVFAAALLAVLLGRVYRSAHGEGIRPDSPEEIEARLSSSGDSG